MPIVKNVFSPGHVHSSDSDNSIGIRNTLRRHAHTHIISAKFPNLERVSLRTASAANPKRSAKVNVDMNRDGKHC